MIYYALNFPYLLHDEKRNGNTFGYIPLLVLYNDGLGVLWRQVGMKIALHVQGRHEGEA